MIFRLVVFCLLSGSAFFAGCASTPRAGQSLAPAREPVNAEPLAEMKAVEPAVVAEPVVTEPVMRKKPGPSAKPRPAGPTVPALREGEYALMVESEPAGATVVVNGKPCGKTPCRVVVQANGRGFLKEQVSIKVRFIAANEAQSSQTVEEVLTTLDKVPTEIRFTTAGATRVVR
ncbi:PEGA domain-containing protein [Nibricoccus aquaticus]|nr:PEGA domain-containing protein [Nibricoccus aquaticus]